MESFIFWDNVKYEMSKTGMKQKELAWLAGINEGTLCNQISKNVVPDVLEAFNIATQLRVSVEYLLTGVEPLEHIPDDLQAVINKYSTK